MSCCIDFEYDGEMLSDYGAMLCSFDNAGGIETESSGADITFNQIRPVGSNRFNLYASTYDTALTSTFQICKNPCQLKTQDEMFFSVEEITAIQRWLCRKNCYKRFKLDKKGYEHIYWNATFSSKQIVLNDNVIGLELTIYTDAPFAFLDEITINIDCSTATNSSPVSFNIYDLSDEEGYIYPDFEITMLEDVTDEKGFRLENSMTNKVTTIKNCIANEVITINGKNQIIETTATLSSRQLSNNFNYLFPRLINTYNENKNTFTCNRKCLIRISYSPIRKIGL